MIAIIGDSWGCGEWAYTGGLVNGKIVHTGLEQHLKDNNYSIVNLSKGNNQNSESLDALEKYLEENNNQIKTVFWFVTCPLRTSAHYIHNDPYEFGIQQLQIFFEYANYLATKYNLKIYALGGLCDIPDEITQQQFSNVKIVIPSISSMLIDNWSKSMFGAANELHKIKMKELALEVANTIEVKLDAFRAAQNWFPDSGHPSKEAHYKVFELVKPLLDN
jgi:hypothetical protein